MLSVLHLYFWSNEKVCLLDLFGTIFRNADFGSRSVIAFFYTEGLKMDMHVMEGPDPVLTRPDLIRDPTLSSYETAGGYQGLRRALKKLTPSEVIGEVKASGLRGRGGSGFPTALKWEKVAEHRIPERYVVANGSEGEPGSHKDHFLISRSPHQILEGMIIASYAVGAKQAHLLVKDSFP